MVGLKKHTYNKMLKLFYLVISFYQSITEKRLEVAFVNGKYKEFLIGYWLFAICGYKP